MIIKAVMADAVTVFFYATEKYMKDKHTIRVVVTKEKADEYKKMAESEGKSLTQFIVDKIENN